MIRTLCYTLEIDIITDYTAIKKILPKQIWENLAEDILITILYYEIDINPLLFYFAI